MHKVIRVEQNTSIGAARLHPLGRAIKVALFVGLNGLAAAMVAPAFAQEAQVSSEPRLPEVTVTAERRETSLQKTPVLVNVVDSTTIEQRNIARISDLAGTAAGVGVPPQYSTNQAVYIRGIGSSRPIGNPSVGLYLDDVYVPRPFSTGLLGNLPDIERFEILHGPQGTLYGQNTSAGALKIITRQPSDTFSASVSTQVGNKGQVEGRGYITGNLVPDLLSASLAIAHSEVAGDVRYPTLAKKGNSYRNDQYRAIFRLTPGDRFIATLSLDGLDGVTFGAPDSVVGQPKRTNLSGFDEGGDFEAGGLSLKLEYQLNDNLDIKSVTATRGFDVTIPFDYDSLPGDVGGFIQDLDQKQFTQELQLLGDYGRFNFITGVMFYKERFEVDRHSWNRNNYSIIDSSSDTRSIGLYGQGTYRFTDKLSLTAGVRFNRERKELDSAAYDSDVNRAQLATIYSVNGLSENYRAVTPKLTVDYQWTPDLLTYFTWAKGETSGGFNPIAASQAIAEIPVDTEKVTNYELGIKNTAWDGRIRTSAALFFNDYSDYQASITNPTINGQPITGGVMVNAGKARTYGVEFESAIQLTSALTANVNAAYLRTRFDEFENPTGAAGSNYVGEELPFAPRWLGGVSLTHTSLLNNGGEVRVTGSVRAETESYSQITPTRDLTKFPSQTYVDGGVFYTTPSGHWTLSLTGKNLFDREYTLPGTYQPALGVHTVTYNRARQVLLGARYDFF